jgi:hypothetical protein
LKEQTEEQIYELKEQNEMQMMQIKRWWRWC